MEYAIERLIVIYVTRNFIEVIFILEKNRLKAVCSPNGGDETRPAKHCKISRKELKDWIRTHLRKMDNF